MKRGKPNILVGLNRWINKYHTLLVFLFMAGFLVSGVITLDLYGISWDEGLGDLFFGERYLFYLTTLQDKYLDFNTDLARLKDLPLQLFLSPFRIYPYEFPPFASTLSAASMHFFSYTLGWLDPVDAFHLFSVVLTTLFLFILYVVFSRRMTRLGAFFSVIFLATFPRLWGDMHFNPKDVPVMAFTGFIIMSYLAWYEKPRLSMALLTGFLFGCGVAIKANAVFTPIIILLGTWPLKPDAATWKANLDHAGGLIHHYFLMGFTSLAVYYLSWPYLYANPLRVMDHVRYIVSQGGRDVSAGWNVEPILQVITTMPEMMLLFLVVGIYFMIRQGQLREQSILRLLLVWMAIPILRISLPGMVNFGGIRHFLEFLPAAGLIAGYGAERLAGFLSGRFSVPKFLSSMVIFLLIGINTFWVTARFHPYQYIYYNSLAGGLRGAANHFSASEATDYWAVSYRKGLEWLNSHTNGEIDLYVPAADWLVRIPQKLWLRPGIQIVDQQLASDILDQVQPLYVMIVNNPDFFDEIAENCVNQLQPEYQITVDGISILYIFHLNPEDRAAWLP